MNNLYTRYPDAMKTLSTLHFPNIVEMCKHFTKSTSMSRALGYTDSVVNRWLHQTNWPSRKSEQYAKVWIDEWKKHDDDISDWEPEPEPELNWVAPLPAPSKSDPLFLVSAKPADAERLRKVLELLNCEVVEL